VLFSYLAPEEKDRDARSDAGEQEVEHATLPSPVGILAE